MAFSAAGMIEPLNYNFRPFVDCSGTTPEPSDVAIRTFNFRMTKATTDLVGAAGINPNDQAAVMRYIAGLDMSVYDTIAEEIISAVVELTQGQPSEEQIRALPGRHQRLYFLSLQRDLTDPELLSVATKPSLVGLAGGASTSR